MTNGHGYVIKPEYTEGLSSWDVSILKDRNVASVKNSVQDAELQILLRNANIEIGEGAGQVNIVYFDSQKDAYAALQNDSIDAASVYSPYASLAKGQGYEVVYYCADEEALQNQPCCRQVALTSALSENPNAYHAFERALIKAYKFSQENQDGTIQDVKTYIDIDEEYIRTEVYGGYSFSSPDQINREPLHLRRQSLTWDTPTSMTLRSITTPRSTRKPLKVSSQKVLMIPCTRLCKSTSTSMNKIGGLLVLLEHENM